MHYFWTYWYPLVTPVAMFIMWLQTVLTQAKSFRFPNHFVTFTRFLPVLVNSILRWLKFFLSIPRAPLIVTVRPLTHILTSSGTVTSWDDSIVFILLANFTFTLIEKAEDKKNVTCVSFVFTHFDSNHLNRQYLFRHHHFNQSLTKAFYH